MCTLLIMLTILDDHLRVGAGRDFVFSSDFGSFPNLIC